MQEELWSHQGSAFHPLWKALEKPIRMPRAFCSTTMFCSEMKFQTALHEISWSDFNIDVHTIHATMMYQYSKSELGITKLSTKYKRMTFALGATRQAKTCESCLCWSLHGPCCRTDAFPIFTGTSREVCTEFVSSSIYETASPIQIIQKQWQYHVSLGFVFQNCIFLFLSRDATPCNQNFPKRPKKSGQWNLGATLSGMYHVSPSLVAAIWLTAQRAFLTQKDVGLERGKGSLHYYPILAESTLMQIF